MLQSTGPRFPREVVSRKPKVGASPQEWDAFITWLEAQRVVWAKKLRSSGISVDKATAQAYLALITVEMRVATGRLQAAGVTHNFVRPGERGFINRFGY
jgi:hypothetical protein